jgi:hypothetical protein
VTVVIQQVDGKRYIVRYARADQFPAGTNLQDAARDSVIRYADQFGLDFEWHHDQYGTVWQRVPFEGGRHGLGVMPGGPDGCYVQKSPITPIWRSEALIREQAPDTGPRPGEQN